MRILIVTTRYWPALGGVETLVRSMAHELAVRHEVTVLALRLDDAPAIPLPSGLTGPTPFQEFQDASVAVLPIEIGMWRRLFLLPLLVHAIPGLRRFAYGRNRVLAGALYGRFIGPVIAQQARRSHVVLLFAGDLLACAAVRAAKAARCPIAIAPSAHGGQWGDDPASASAYRRADIVIAQLKAEGDVYRGLGVPSERIKVLGAGTRPLPVKTGDALRACHNIVGPLVLFLGARRPYKGIDILLATAALVAASRPDVCFALVGPGPPIARPVPANVFDIGEVDEDDKASWLHAADILCLPSAAESFGLVVAEAWSARKPVIVSNIPALRELVEGVGGGLVAAREPSAMATAILTLVEDPAVRSRLGNAGWSAWRDHFSIHATACRYEKELEELTRQPRAWSESYSLAWWGRPVNGWKPLGHAMGWISALSARQSARKRGHLDEHRVELRGLGDLGPSGEGHRGSRDDC